MDKDIYFGTTENRLVCIFWIFNSNNYLLIKTNVLNVIFCVDPSDELKYTQLMFTLKPNELKSTVMWSSEQEPPNLEQVTILGIMKPVKSVSVNGQKMKYKYDSTDKVSMIKKHLNIFFFCKNVPKRNCVIFSFQFLLINNLDVSMTKDIIIQWIVG